jgi:hypothetical protein
MMFWEKQRPKGLEFAACASCNNGSSHADLVASLLGRTGADPKNEAQRDELVKLLRAVSNNVPGLLQDMELPFTEEERHLRRLPAEHDQ